MSTAPDAAVTTHRLRCQAIWGGEPPSLGPDAFQRGRHYKWQRPGPSIRERRLKSGAFATNVAVFDKVLPPNAEDFMDSKACEDFNEYVKVTGHNEYFITLPPKLFGLHACSHRTPSDGYKSATECALVLRALDQVRLVRVEEQLFRLSCTAHGEYETDRDAHKRDFDAFRAWRAGGHSADSFRSTLFPNNLTAGGSSPAQFTRQSAFNLGSWFQGCLPGLSAFDSLLTEPRQKTQLAIGQGLGIQDDASSPSSIIRKSHYLPQSAHERYCKALFGLPSLQRRDSFQYSDTYRWQFPPCDGSPGLPDQHYKIGDLVAQKLLPPDPTDYTSLDICEDFDRYVKLRRPTRLYAVVPPKSGELRCAHEERVMRQGLGEYASQWCPSLLLDWCQAELSLIDENTYSARCLEHRGQDEHTAHVEQQREDFRQFRKTGSIAESPSLPPGDEKSRVKRSFSAPDDEGESLPRKQIRLDAEDVALGSSELTGGTWDTTWSPFDTSTDAAPPHTSGPITLADDTEELVNMPWSLPLPSVPMYQDLADTGLNWCDADINLVDENVLSEASHGLPRRCADDTYTGHGAWEGVGFRVIEDICKYEGEEENRNEALDAPYEDFAE